MSARDHEVGRFKNIQTCSACGSGMLRTLLQPPVRFCWAYPVGGGKWSEQVRAIKLKRPQIAFFECTSHILLWISVWRLWRTFRLRPPALPSSCTGATFTSTNMAGWWQCASDPSRKPCAVPANRQGRVLPVNLPICLPPPFLIFP